MKNIDKKLTKKFVCKFRSKFWRDFTLTNYNNIPTILETNNKMCNIIEDECVFDLGRELFYKFGN